MTSFVTPSNGTKFYLKIGDGADPEVFSFLCVGTTVQSDEGTESEDAWSPDCDDPTNAAERVTVIKGLTWDVSGSGLMDQSKACYQRLKTVYRSAAPGNFQLLKTMTGGETMQASFVVTKITEQMTDRGLVKADFTLKAQGAPTITPNA